MRILLAISYPDLSLSLQLLLSEQPGVEIVGSATESEGFIALVHTTQPDMILADWDMVGQSFPKLLQEIKTTSRPKIILLTTDPEDYQLAQYSKQIDAVVLKGLPPDVLLNTFQQLRTHNQEGDSS